MGVISLVIFVCSNQELEVKTITATFNSFEEEIYYFSNKDAEYTFEEVAPEALKSYDLNDDKFIGKNFKVSYTEKELLDEFEEPYSVWVITKLVLIK